MKQFFRYTSTLLRTALLLGAMTIVNIPTQAQPVSLTADMPDAFETKKPVIGDGEYYFIQFYEEVNIAPYLFVPFVGEFGEGNMMHACDYVPFSQNRQWTLEDAGLAADGETRKFRLKSKRGFYAYYGYHSDPSHPDNNQLNKNCFMGTMTQTPTEFVLKARTNFRAGYYEIEVESDQMCLSREKGNGANTEWADMIKNPRSNAHNYVRFVQLKPTAAHIIYYREEGVENGQYRANFTTTRHYLTYSGVDHPYDGMMTSVIKNGSMERADASSFYIKTPNSTDPQSATITDGVGYNGSRGVSITSSASENPQPWDTQFFIRSQEIIPEGRTFHLEFRYRADQNVTVATQAHAEPGNYNHWGMLGDLTFTTDWQYFSRDITVTDQMDRGTDLNKVSSFQTIAFNLWTGTSVTFYFDDVVFTAPAVSDVSSRQSIIPSDKSLWTLPTAAAYHQDGLWKLEETGNEGEFYIKKHESTDEYLNADGTLSVLGKKNDVSGKYKLVEPTANRYTLIQNVKYQADDLTSGMFYNWNGYGSGANITGTPSLDNNVGTAVGGGAMIVGPQYAGVEPLIYADLSSYSKMVIRGTQDMQLRVLMNRQESNNGPWFEKNVTIGSDGIAMIDLNTNVGQAEVKATYINGDNGAENYSPGEVTTALCGYNAISGGYVTLGNQDWGENEITFLKVDASAINGTITKVMLAGEFQGNSNHDLYYGVGYNNSEWSSDLTWNTSDRSIITLGNTQTVERNTNEKTLSFDITGAFTDSKVKTILVYKAYAYSGYIKNPRVYVEYVPNDGTKCVHLNAIKAAWGNGGIGTVTSISLVNQNNEITTGDPTCVNHNNGDGWPVLQRSGSDQNYWYAAFYPVEVPVSQKDEFFQVLVGLRSSASSSGPTEMVNYSGTASTYSEDENQRILWQLEQADDYLHYRLKRPDTGEYLAGFNLMTEPNDPNGESYEGANKAEVYKNEKFFTNSGFTLKWFIPTKKVDKEFIVDGYVLHKESYLRAYADDQVIANQEGLRKQGLSRDIDSDWKNFNGNLDGFTQNTNHFEITHYIKKGNSTVIEFPTVLNRNNDHVYFQRFYHYDEIDTGAEGTGMDLANLKAHVSLDTRDDGNVQYFLYKNGMVTGQKLDWRTYDSENGYTAIPDGGMARNEQRRFNFTNSDGERFTVGVDVSRYSDLEYKNSPDHLAGDLIEPSLTMRYIFYMRDAKEMAKSLTACPEGGSKWLEAKTFHFGRTQVPYTKFKKVGYRGEFIPVRHVFSDYWVYNDPQLIDENYLASLKNTNNWSDEELNDYLDKQLVNAVTSNTSGKIEVEVIPGNTGIRKGGYNPALGETALRGYGDDDPNEENYQGFYFYDLLSPSVKHEYGNSRFTVFRYPESGIVENYGLDNPAYINVYVNDGNGKRYQLAQYTIIFDANMATRPWTEIKNGTTYANGINKVKGEDRDPNKLRLKAGKPIAKVTFDYPVGNTYHYPINGDTRHDGGVQTVDENGILHYWVNENDAWVERTRPGIIDNSSPIPLTFNHTNYAFDGDGCNWGSYALVTQKRTIWGNNKIILPADDETYGYNLPADPGMQKAFLYIDASEQPGDICAVDFEGEFCPSDKLMCSGWISGSNKIQGDTRCPGSITITMKGEDVYGNTKTIYRFCPGQIYELDDGYQKPGGDVEMAAGIDGNGNGATHVVWQQFFFEFSTDQKYERYWLEVNNNCVSSNGGDFMIDNVEVYTIVPEVEPEINTPLCISVKEDGTTETEMSLLRLDVDYNKLKSSANVSSGTAKIGFVFLEKDVFLKKLWDLKDLASSTNPVFENIDSLAVAIKEGKYLLANDDPDYIEAFDAALLGNKTIWDSSKLNSDNPSPMGGGIMYFQWSATFEDNTVQPLYSFAKAVNKQGATFRYVDDEGGRWLVFNGNYPGLNWKTNTDYYIVPTNTRINDNLSDLYELFNICSICSKASVFRIEPPYELLGLEKSEDANDYMVCEGQIPTLLTDLKGYDFNGVEIPMNDINYDWWLGDKANGLLATLENYHAQQKGGVRLDKALATLRARYPDVTSLDGVSPRPAVNGKPELTQPMIDYLKELVEAGQLVLHQKSISIPAEPNSADDPYFYLVACPIHDEVFNQALNPADNQYVAFFCDEPQGLRVKVGDKAPTLKTGFVSGENGFDSYNYTGAGDAVLSIRLAKREQFETVKHGEPDAATIDTPTTANAETTHFLWLPVRNAIVQTDESDKVIQKSEDENIYLASTNDPVWDKNIYKAMKKGSLPVVGKIVQLNAIDVSKNSNLNENDYNRLCVYFTENFDVREGYSYTLSLPFQESPGENTCDGTILINLKIVPDYEVWTGAAGNTDWNNDENWRRADGNLGKSTEEPKNGAGRNSNELYRTDDLPDTSPLKDYVTNYTNYRTAKDRLLRKGFAPLYCTHVLIKSNEWGDAPVLYDALAGKDVLDASPFPNLRDKDGWDGTVTDEDAGTVATKATSTPILRYDMQARLYDIWSDTYGSSPNKGRTGDLIAEMYQVNSCDEIAFQPTAELLNAHLLNYNNAWVEYQLDNKRWYLLGSPLQGTISGEWYAPTGTAQQKTTYYENVKFGAGYDRYSPAIYQRSWDKAKAVLYEIGSEYSTADNPDDLALNNDGTMPGFVEQGAWNEADWNASGADDYLDRLGYKPLGNKKVNVAIKGVWSNTYNDATVDYTKGGFSVMVMNHLKGNDDSNGKSIIRLPKEDTMYDYYKFEQTGAADGGTDTYLSDTNENDYDDVQTNLNRALNRGRLKTDQLLPTIGEGLATYLKIQRAETTASRYGDMRTYTRVPTRVGTNALPMTLQPFTESVSAGISNLGYYLVENPFVAGLDMEKFFAANPGLEKKYWILTPNGQQLVQRVAGEDWVSPTEEVVTGEEPNTETTYHFTAANAKVAPGQGFFVQAKTAGEATTITFTADMQAQTRYGEPDEGTEYTIVVGTKQKMTTVGVTYDDDDNPETPEVPLMIDDDNDPSTPDVQATVEVPEVDNDGNPVVEDIKETVTIYQYKQKKGVGYEFPLKARTRTADAHTLGLVITAQRGDLQSSALVMQHEGASNDFLPLEDTETFICTEDLKQVPTVYTLCGRLATTINSIHDFRSLSLGVESASDAPCSLTFRGVEQLGDSVAFYDAVERTLTPLESGMKFKVSGQTQNRYYLVRSLNLEEAAEETHLQIFTEGLTAKVIASTQEPITSVRCYDTSGRLVFTANPMTPECSFRLPAAGIYIIEAQTEHDRKTQKHICK